MVEKITEYIKEKEELIERANKEIWDYAELAFEEEKSAKLYMDMLKDEGFIIEDNLANMPTAFRASYGSGKPVIAILGEYDALPNLSQEAGVSEFSQIEKGGNGHGCGHNSLGAASFGAALAVKEYMMDNDKFGTIEFYGCPAEENGNGKSFMVRDGVFDDVDIALTWHPGDLNAVLGVGTLASISVAFHFKGVTSHAAASPHLGRSALDSAEIMNVGVNYLREHIIPEARVHYAYLDVGGTAPNVVQESSTLHYFIRAPKIKQAQEIYERIVKIAQASAMMNETEVEIEFFTAMSNFVPNTIVSEVLQESYEEIGAPKFDDEDYELAKNFFNSFTEIEKQNLINLYSEDILNRPLSTKIQPLFIQDISMPGSTDVGDVSQVVPTGQIISPTVAIGTAHHTWQMTAQHNTSIALKGTKTAAKVMASAACKFLDDEDLYIEAKEELDKKIGQNYISPIPKDINPIRNR